MAGNGHHSNGSDRAHGSPAATVEVLWVALTDVMGNAATATLLRRAAMRAAIRAPELGEFSVVRDRFNYRYVVPASWSAASPKGSASLRELLVELRPLLVDLTGPVVLHRLRDIPALRESDLFLPESKQ